MNKFLFFTLLILSFTLLCAVESDPSETVGYVKYPCLAGLNMCALGMDTGYALASDLANANPGMLDAINYWDNSTQEWVASTYIDFLEMWDPDFDLYNGLPLWVSSLDDFDMFILGGLPAENASYDLVPGLTLIMMPLDQSAITLCSELGAAVGTLDAINVWDNTTQEWVASTYIDFLDMWDPDFDLSIGQVLWLSSIDTTTWPGTRGRSVVPIPTRAKPQQSQNK